MLDGYFFFFFPLTFRQKLLNNLLSVLIFMLREFSTTNFFRQPPLMYHSTRHLARTIYAQNFHFFCRVSLLRRIIIARKCFKFIYVTNGKTTQRELKVQTFPL